MIIILLISLCIVSIGELVLIHLIVEADRKERVAAQIRHTEAIRDKEHIIAALTESLVRSEGKHLPPLVRAPIQLPPEVAGWATRKSPEKFVK